MPTTDTYMHRFRTSVDESACLEQAYFADVLSLVLLADGYQPVDLRASTVHRTAGIDFGGMVDNDMMLTAEAKFDHAEALTGNLFLETISVDKGNESKEKPGWILSSEAEYLHQISIMSNKVYISKLQDMREYWYDGAMPRIFHREFAHCIRHRVRVLNDNYDSYGDCIVADVLFGEHCGHYKQYVVDVTELPEHVLEFMVPQSDAILLARWGAKWINARPQCPSEVLKWLP